MNIKFVTISFICIVVFSFSYTSYSVEGFTLFKLFYTCLAWLLLFIAGTSFIINFNTVSNKFGRKITWLFSILLLWNIKSIVRATINNPNDIVNIFGNEQTAIILLMSIVIIFAINIYLNICA